MYIDGFDEVPREERDKVMATLAQTASFSRSIVKVFLSSRQDVGKEILTAFQCCQKTTTSCPKVDADIAAYIGLSIDEKLANGELVLGDLSNASVIRNALANGANGMFVH